MGYNKLMEFEAPTKEDWIKIQGHEPLVEKVDGNMVNIIHPNRVVPTPLVYFEKMGKINLTVPGTNRIVCTYVAYLEQFHGIPCEQRSRAAG